MLAKYKILFKTPGAPAPVFFTPKKGAFFYAVFLCAFCGGALSAQDGFYADVSGQYVSNTLEGVAKEAVQGVELGINLGYKFKSWLGAGLISSLSLGYYNIYGDLTEYDGPRFTTTMLEDFPIYRFDIVPYVSITKELTYWLNFSLGAGVGISIYQYIFYNMVNDKNQREILGTQSFNITLIPEIQFKIYEHITFGIRMQIAPVSFGGKSVYVFYFSGETMEGNNSFKKEGLDVQNHIFKFGIFAGYSFGTPYYSPKKP
ncbi:MAG: hypothetical protein LBC53_05405 [Spirochaetaceae bacterium]|jgi:hypothetical protein|nr:hypothetical protein [Spirochaetaceae bacterium]